MRADSWVAPATDTTERAQYDHVCDHNRGAEIGQISSNDLEGQSEVVREEKSICSIIH